MTTPERLSIIVPVYNEVRTVRAVLDRLVAIDLPVDREILVVDDGSTDGTRELLTGVSHPQITVLLAPQNGGKGSAIRRGLAAAAGSIVAIQDADLEYSPEEFPQLIELICQGRADVVYGSRFLGRHRVFLFTHYAGHA